MNEYLEIAAAELLKKAAQQENCGRKSMAVQFYKSAANKYRQAAESVPGKKSEYLALARDIEEKIESLDRGVAGNAAENRESYPKLNANEDKNFRAKKEKDITFADVAGLDEIKEQIRYKVLEPIKNPEFAQTFHIKPGAKMLLYGPPGTGKTFIARAIAGEVDAEFYAVNCQDLISKYMGESSKKLDELFEKAQQNERAIIFFDEFDSVAGRRGDGSDGVDAEMARFVATFLTKVDGFEKSKTNKMLLLIAATNRPWTLDPAMLRGGRFDTHIYVGVPDRKAREFLVNKELKDVPKDKNLDLSRLALELDGYGCGDITSICEKIRLKAYMRSLKAGTIQNVTVEDCNTVLQSSRNMITAEELEKFKKFQTGGSIN